MTSTLTDEQQRARDLEHLKLLGVFFYIVGAITLCFSCLAILYIAIGVGVMLNPGGMKGNPPIPPQLFGLLFAVVGAMFMLTGWTIGALAIYAGRCVQTRRRRFFVLVASGVLCLFYPFGTALGVAAFFVLSRDSVKNLFES